MKQNMLLIIVITILCGNIDFIVADNDWQSNGLLIQGPLSNLAEQLLGDAAMFDSISQEIDQLVDIINAKDLGEQVAIKGLITDLTNLIQQYQAVLQQQKDVQVQNAAALQQLKIVLATVLSTLQEKISQLTAQNAQLQDLYNQSNDEYNQAVAGNQQEAADLLAVLRSVASAYDLMDQNKQISLGQLNDILTALTNHIANATAGFNQLNAIINQ